MDATRIIFLGSGGGRFATFLQERATGGLYILDKKRLHIDPGPGAATMMKTLKIDPTKTDGIFVSHCHPDHYANAEILIEGMTNGGFKKRGVIIASSSALTGIKNFSPAISRYHQDKVRHVIMAKAGGSTKLASIPISFTPARHSDPTTVGFKIQTMNGTIGYIPDTSLFDELKMTNQGARVLVVPCTRPLGFRIAYHLSTEDCAELIARVRPEIAVLNHFGMKILARDAAVEQAEWVTAETGIPTIAANDGLELILGDKVRWNMHFNQRELHAEQTGN